MKFVIGVKAIVGALTMGIVGTFLGLAFGVVTNLDATFPLSADVFATFGAISLGALGLVTGAGEDAKDAEHDDEMREIKDLHRSVRTAMIEKSKTEDFRDTLDKAKEEKQPQK